LIEKLKIENELLQKEQQKLHKLVEVSELENKKLLQELEKKSKRQTN